MKIRWLLALFLISTAVCCFTPCARSQRPRFKVLAFYSTKVERDHVLFANGALKFFSQLAAKDNFTFESTTNWDNMNASNLAKYQLVVWLNDQPPKQEQRRAFQQYMEKGGGWLGFHVTAYNDKDTNWPWFVDFLGGGVFYTNSWPPLPAKLTVDDRSHPVTKDLPSSFVAPDNEWYIWEPSPRLSKNVRVLITLDPSNYPLGLKDILKSGDLPVVWTNTKYKMLYMNMGHGDKLFISSTQNTLFENAILWAGTNVASPPAPAAGGMRISPNAVVVNPKTGKAYAVNAGDTITVLNGSANSGTTVKVGSDPIAIAVNSATNKVYVANLGSDTVSVIDGATDTVTATVKVGEIPYMLAANPVTNNIYVSRTLGNFMDVIDGATNTTTPLGPRMQADAIAVNPVTNKIYMTTYEGQDVTILDGTTHAVSSVPVGLHIWAIALNHQTNKLYLAVAGSDQLAVLDGANNVVTHIAAGHIPCAVAVDPAANRIYVVNYADGTVTVIDGITNSAVATVKVGDGPEAIAVNSETHAVYVANTHSNSVSVIRGSDDSVVQTVPTGPGPYAIAINTKTNGAYVSNLGKNNLTVINGPNAQ
jgi:YVTN family beta-propeller protein